MEFPYNINLDKTDLLIGRNIIYLDEIDSTNNEIKRQVNYLQNGDIIFANHQINGKGRLGRNWFSKKGTGITMSIFIKPENTDIYFASLLSIAMNIACINSIKKTTNLDARVKWPNDIIINEKKVCGILCESVIKNNKLDYVVCGIGININIMYQDLPKDLVNIATTLAIEANKAIDISYFAEQLILQVNKIYSTLTNKDTFDYVMEEYKNLCINMNQNIKIIINKNTVEGKVININDLGHLIIETEDGKIREICSGEATIKKNQFTYI